MLKEEKNKIFTSGFTLVEMAIVVAVLSILVMSAVPKINGLIRSSHEGATKAKLAAIRTALSVYYVDNEGSYPFNLEPLTQPGSKYLTRMLPLYTKEHGFSYKVVYSSYVDASANDGAWGYVNTLNKERGRVWVRSIYPDRKGKIWNTY